MVTVGTSIVIVVVRSNGSLGVVVVVRSKGSGAVVRNRVDGQFR